MKTAVISADQKEWPYWTNYTYYSMKLDTFHIVEIENNFKPDIIDERHKYHNDDNTNLTESGKVNTTNFEVYFKFNDY